MRKHVEAHFGPLKTTAIGGVVFLLPLIVVGALVAQAAQVVWRLAEPTKDYLPIDTVGGYATLLAVVVLLLLLVCFVSGMIATRSVGRWFTERAERSITMLFPRYAVFKDQLAGNLGGDVARGRLKPVVATIGRAKRLGIEVDRSADGVTVYLPDSPDPWSGSVAQLPAEDVSEIEADFAEVLTTFEQLGRGSARFFTQGQAGRQKPAASTTPGAARG